MCNFRILLPTAWLGIVVYHTQGQNRYLAPGAWPRGTHSDFTVGGDMSPPNGGDPWGGTKARWGGDLCVIRDKIIRSLNKPKMNPLNYIFLFK